MKWLFATLVALNLIVFAGMIAHKISKSSTQSANIALRQQTPLPENNMPQIIINNNGGGNTIAPTSGGNRKAAAPKSATPTVPAKPQAGGKAVAAEQNTRREKSCTASVSLPKDDYHRIKGLLSGYQHVAAEQQVKDGSGQYAAKINVRFISVSNAEADNIRGIVGRYGMLHHVPCDR